MFLFLPVSTSFAATASSKKELGPIRKTTVENFVPQANMFASALVVDAATGKELYSFKPTKVWSGASLTKLMTALVFTEKRPAWDTVVKLARADEVGGGRLRLAIGSRFTVKDAFYSSLVGSANNATMTLARSTGYSIPGYVRLMNKKAKALGMTQTSYADPSGMEVDNLTTARDLVKLMRAAFANASIRTAASTGVYKFTAQNPTTPKTILTTDKLHGDSDINIIAAKTGFLYESMYNFVMKVQPEGKTGRTLYVVVLGAPTKEGSFDAAESLAKWAWNAYKWD